jgi:hypothetical protein
MLKSLKEREKTSSSNPLLRGQATSSSQGKMEMAAWKISITRINTTSLKTAFLAMIVSYSRTWQEKSEHVMISQYTLYGCLSSYLQ